MLCLLNNLGLCPSISWYFCQSHWYSVFFLFKQTNMGTRCHGFRFPFDCPLNQPENGLQLRLKQNPTNHTQCLGPPVFPPWGTTARLWSLAYLVFVLLLLLLFLFFNQHSLPGGIWVSAHVIHTLMGGMGLDCFKE